MRFRYYYCGFHRQELIDLLNENGIPHKIYDYGTPNKTVVFNIWSHQSYAEYCITELKKMKYTPLIYIEYSETERKNAKFLWMHPKKQKIKIINGDQAFRFECEYTSIAGKTCYVHEYQQSLIAIAKEPSFKTKTVFWTVEDGFSEIFVNRRVYEAVKSSNLVGVDFLNIILRSGEYSDNLFQMTSSNVIPRECIQSGHGEIVERCCVCGKEQYTFSNHPYQLHLDLSQIDKESDLHVTERMYGAGIAYPLYVISQRFYRLLKENGLMGGVEFAPVVDIS